MANKSESFGTFFFGLFLAVPAFIFGMIALIPVFIYHSFSHFFDVLLSPIKKKALKKTLKILLTIMLVVLIFIVAFNAINIFYLGKN